VQKLKPGGYIHVATDWQDYCEQVLAVLSAEPLLGNTAADYAPRPEYRPLTKFEQRGIRLGHGVWDMVFAAKDDYWPLNSVLGARFNNSATISAAGTCS